jgi:hypothetical protein
VELKAVGTLGKVALWHIISAEDTAAIVSNGAASLSYWAYLPSGANIDKIRAGVVEHDGVADACDADPIDAWSAEDTDPTIVAAWGATYANTPVDDQHTSKDDTWTQITIENITIASSTTNLGILIWIEDRTHLINEIALVGGVQLEPGASATAFIVPEFATSLQSCQRRFYTTYDYAVAPGANPADEGKIVHPTADAINYLIDTLNMDVRFPVPMLKTPTCTVYAPTSGNSTFVSNPGDIAATVTFIGTSGCTIHVDGEPVLDILAAHLTAEAEPTT